jgi:hydrogenase expression/formation protein HypD
MSLQSDFSDPLLAKPIVDEIGDLAGGFPGTVKIMEVCGTHTVSLRKHGIHSLLPGNVKLISGPGCPVCVTPTGYIDNALHLAEREDVLIATFGDMLKVPGSAGISLASLTGRGRVRMVYSPTELIALAQSRSGPVVFLGIGFETTIPTVAAIFLRAAEMGLENLYLYTAFKTIPGPLKILLTDPSRDIQAFMLPGHVSVIIGRSAYSFLEEADGIPGVITGFEPLDMLYGILLVLRQLASGTNRVENAYPRAVREDGNARAREVIDKLLHPVDAMWRGLGMLPDSGMGLKEEYRRFDAAPSFGISKIEDYEPPGCLCGKVIQGKVIPTDCSLYAGQCTPDHPVGPCMVSSEGTCAAYLRYGGTIG